MIRDPPRHLRHHPRPTHVPPPVPAGTRIHIGWATLRAAYDAHRCEAHDDRVVLGCGVCTTYADVVTAARNHEHRAEPDPPT